MSLRDPLPVWVAALWWGSLLTTGCMAVPVLFSYASTPAIAGALAARLFTAQTWLSLGCALLLLLMSQSHRAGTRMDWARGALFFVVAGMLLAMLTEFAVAPRIVARQNLRLWHAVGSGMLVLQWIRAGTVLWKLTSGLKPAGPS